MEDMTNILDGSWDSLLSLFPSDVSAFIISILVVIVIIAVWRMVVGG